MGKAVFIIIIILGIILGVFGFWYWQKNSYSKEILKVEIIGAERAKVFEEIEYTVKLKNNGNIRLEDVHFVFEFPKKSFLDGENSSVAEVGPEEISDIYPGEEKIFQFKRRLFGEVGEVKKAVASVRYRPKELKAFYESKTEFITVLEEAPISFDFDLPVKIEKGRDFNFYLNYFSNLDYPLSGLGIKLEYPDGFELINSNPNSLDEKEWEIPLLNETEGGRIEIRGRLTGKAGDQKKFKAVLGIWRDDQFVQLKEIVRKAAITNSRIFVFQQVNGSQNYIATPGDSLHYEIFFRNISDEPFKDLFLAVSLDSPVFDLESIKTENGKFNKGDNSIVWDWRDIPDLRFLDTGKEAKVDFWVDLKDFVISGEDKKNAVAKNSVLISHTREEFEIKLNSNLEIYQKAYYYDEVFGNSGPIPPRAGEATTYTIIWEARNYYNKVLNIKARAVLPSNVNLTGKIFPDEQKPKFTFDQESREIVWHIGDMEAGEGVINPSDSPYIAFQVSLVPNNNQIGGRALLIHSAKIEGEDEWTEKTIERLAPEVYTDLPDDDKIDEGQGIVK